MLKTHQNHAAMFLHTGRSHQIISRAGYILSVINLHNIPCTAVFEHHMPRPARIGYSQIWSDRIDVAIVLRSRQLPVSECESLGFRISQKAFCNIPAPTIDIGMTRLAAVTEPGNWISILYAQQRCVNGRKRAFLTASYFSVTILTN